jgi:hypothetical protein
MAISQIILLHDDIQQPFQKETWLHHLDLKEGEREKKGGKLLRQFLAKFDCNLLLHETLKEGGELRL